MKYAIHVRRTQAGTVVIDRTLIVEARSGAHAQGVVKQWLRQQDIAAMEQPGYQRSVTWIGPVEPGAGKPDLLESDYLDRQGKPPYGMKKRVARRR